jgi:hypothetical protein
MKKFLIILIISLLIGCLTTQKHVSTMYDWELRNEYSDLQLKHMQLEREMIYGGHTYTTKGYPPMQTSNSAYGGILRGLQMADGITTTVHNPAIKKLNKVENRMREIEHEMSRRGILP